jgi:LysR family transcriptional regulator, benzoate and cis,cis-muconate-responsive activator of ben and cat genes
MRCANYGLGLVAAGDGVCLVPASVERLRRDDLTYWPLDQEQAVSPIILSNRKGDRSSEIALVSQVDLPNLSEFRGGVETN